jgi:SM-20-related protein
MEPESSSTVPGIRVLDDFLPMYDDLAEMIAGESLVYGSRSNARTDPHGHWTQSFAMAGRTNLADVSGDLNDDPRLAPVKRAWEFLQERELPDDVLIRCYVNGYTFGTDGYFHTDSQRSDEHTAVIYMNSHWEPDWAGETVFLDTRDEICQSVLPKRNRAVIFPSDLQHAARGVSRKCSVLRKTLIFKARRRRSGSFEKLSSFLRQAGATKLGHKPGTLHDHLVRTFSLLEARRAEMDVCFAGGLHSAYGTNAYAAVLLASDYKQKVTDEFGARAEELASIFAKLERPKTLETPLELSAKSAVVELRTKETMILDRAIFDDLRLMECANLADQTDLSKYKTLSAIWRARQV